MNIFPKWDENNELFETNHLEFRNYRGLNEGTGGQIGISLIQIPAASVRVQKGFKRSVTSWIKSDIFQSQFLNEQKHVHFGIFFVVGEKKQDTGKTNSGIGGWSHNLKQVWLTITLPETNIAPENRPSQKETSIPTPTINFQVLC